MALVLAALSADGESINDNVHLIERGYENLPARLRSLGASIEKVEKAWLMERWQQNIDLKPCNTFSVSATCRYFATFSSDAELQFWLATREARTFPVLILGGGSNILFTRDFNGCALLNAVRGFDMVLEDDHSVIWSVGAGMPWDAVVEFAVCHRFRGIENSSGIPDNVGAAPR